jgi:hypothetical protein
MTTIALISIGLLICGLCVWVLRLREDVLEARRIAAKYAHDARRWRKHVAHTEIAARAAQETQARIDAETDRQMRVGMRVLESQRKAVMENTNVLEFKKVTK